MTSKRDPLAFRLDVKRKETALRWKIFGFTAPGSNKNHLVPIALMKCIPVNYSLRPTPGMWSRHGAQCNRW